MTPKFDPSKVLYSDLRAIEYLLKDLTLEFAVLGYLDVARRLVSLLHSHGGRTSAAVSIDLKSLWFAWQETGEWPTGELERAKREKKMVPKSGDEEPARKSQRIAEKQAEENYQAVEETLVDMAQDFPKSWFFPDKSALGGRASGAEVPDGEEASAITKVLEAIRNMDDFADATSGSTAMDKSSGLVRALDLRIKLADQGHVDEDKVPSVDEILGMIASRMHSNYQINYLIQSARAWKILKDGALAKAVGVDDEKVQSLAKEVEKTFKLRLEGGKKRRPERSMSELLKELAHNTVTNPSSREVLMGMKGDEGEPDSPFDGRKPATPEEITELEKRLKITLPDDYKEFLGLTNGFGTTWGGILHDPPLHPTTDVNWFGDDEDYFYDLHLDLVESEINAMVRDYPVIADAADSWPTVGMAIDIGNEDIDSVWLLPPANVEKQRAAYLEILDNEIYPEELKRKVLSSIDDFAGSLENFKKLDWCTLTWASGGSAQMESFSSFKDYIASKVVDSANEYHPNGDDGNFENKCFAYSCR